jgi:adenine/guanine phosphoribosyltransferase-like PRPP-binding protein
VVAMVDYRVGDRMHRRLRGYKDAPVAEIRQACAADLTGLVRKWMTAGRADLEARFGSPWDLVATVPSSGRPVGVPVDALVAQGQVRYVRHRNLLVRGPEPTDHLRAARRGFELAPAVDREWLRGKRILVFDDSITTGARSQSAAAALRLAGGRVVGVMAVGRVVAGGRWATRPVLG